MISKTKKGLESVRPHKAIVAMCLAGTLAGCASFGAKDPHACEGTAVYTAEFKSSWTAATHPTDFPEKAHYSSLIGATHDSENPIWALGEKASPGIKDVAEKGLNAKLIKEVNWAVKIDEAGALIHGADLKESSGVISVDFEADNEFSQLSLLTMIAPSPDWFVGISGLNLCERGTWLARKSIVLDSYDAGTDSGASYTAEDLPTVPQGVITVLPQQVLANNTQEPAFATLELSLKAVRH